MRHSVALLAGVAAAGCAFNPTGVTGPDGNPGDAAIDDAAIDAPIDGSGPDGGGPDGGDPDGGPTDGGAIDAPIDGGGPDGGPTTSRVLVDDTAGDFGQGDPSLDLTRLDPTGAVAPQAFYRGALCAGGSNDRLFDDGAAGSWAMLPAPARPGLARTLALNLPDNGIPAGVGITNGSDWTLWWYGEVFLTAGAHQLGLTADDHGFWELAAPGTANFQTRLSTNWNSAAATATYTATVTGWHPVRMAVAQRDGGVGLSPTIDGTAIPRRRTRCRADTFQGLALTGFDTEHFVNARATTIVGDATAANIDWGFSRPGDLGLSGDDTFSVRWSGQAFIDVAGTYTLRAQSDDGFRLWVDGVAVAADVTDGVKNVTTGNLVLARGWHDLVFDVTESTLAAKAFLTVASGPELAGQPFPPARLRPVEGRGQQFESISGGATGDLTVDLDPGAVLTGADVGYVLDVGTTGSFITTRLTHGATTETLRNNSHTLDTTEGFSPPNFGGVSPGGPWDLRITGGSGTLTTRWLTASYSEPAGNGPTPATSRFVSSVRDLLASGGATVASLGTVDLLIRAATGASVTIAFRTCDTEGACAALPWSAEFATGAGLAGITPRRFLQYRLTFSTDGDHEPAVERVQIDFATR